MNEYNGMSIEMNSKHQYLVGGIRTISVTQILHRMFPTKYEGVPESTLERAANRGNLIHEMIEKYALSQNMDDRLELNINGINYHLLEMVNDISIASCERPVAYLDGDRPLYCGTYDMLGMIGNDQALLDIKCTAKCDKRYLQWQLSMYAMAIEQMDDRYSIKKLACIWMPKNGVGQFVPIKRLDNKKVLQEVRKIVGTEHNAE